MGDQDDELLFYGRNELIAKKQDRIRKLNVLKSELVSGKKGPANVFVGGPGGPGTLFFAATETRSQLLSGLEKELADQNKLLNSLNADRPD